MSPSDAAEPPAPRGAEAASAPAPRRSALAIVTMLLVLALAGVHMFFTVVANTPDARIKAEVLPGQIADDYLRPYFVQNYRIFAPNPASEDRELWVRAQIRGRDGEIRETPWINATAVELADPVRRVLRKQLTIVSAEGYWAAYQGLSEVQREVISGGNFAWPGGRERMQEVLESYGEATAYLRHADHVTAYATQVAHAMYPESELVAVQSKAVYEPVVRWENRHDPDASPPARWATLAGWGEPIEYAQQDREEFARSFMRWLDRAGEAAYPQ